MINYKIDFLDGAKVSIIKGDSKNYKIYFINNDTNNIEYSTILSEGKWAKTNTRYFINWNIKIEDDNSNIIVDYNLNLENKKVLVTLESRSLGDSLAWTPYVEEFRKKHNCEIYYSTFKNELFLNKYDKINFIKPGIIPENTFAKYRIGWFNPIQYNNPQDYKKIPMQQTSSDILGLKYKEIKPIINTININKPVNYKYVCIAEYSTANAKHWHYPNIDNNKGWQTIVDWLNHIGYKVMVISLQETKLKNIIDRTGNYPLSCRMIEIQHSEFFIGVGSGLSWLAWALNKKVVMISGFSEPYCEFKEDNIRIHNPNVCHGCFNHYKFDRGDWNWCPVFKNTSKQFECTRNITPKMVATEIVKNKLVDNLSDFNFDY